MAHVVEVVNPFEPFEQTVHPCEGGCTIAEWLRTRFPGWLHFDRPTLCLRNGHAVPQDRWELERIEATDVVSFITLPGNPIMILYVIVAVLVVATVTLALKASQATTATQQTPQADSVFNLSGQRNQTRLSYPIEVIYGRVRRYPSYAAQPYRKYENNQQWLFQLFCIGHGSFSVEGWYIEDTPLANFQDVTIEVCPPGTPVTLFPDNVITSAEVNNLELYGTNEPEAGATWVVDSEGDDSLDPPIEPTGHYAITSAGPYVLNPSGTQTNLIEVDVSLPRGLYISNDDGSLGSLTATALFEVQEIDDAGDPVGDWVTLATFSQTLATVTPQRYTLSAAVTLGRYQIRASRTNDKNLSARAGNTIQWEQARAFLLSTRDYGNVTMVALKVRASNNLNDNSQNRFNGWLVRELPSWDKDLQVWNDAAPTRSIAWAMADVFRNTEYGAALADSFLDLGGLADINAEFTEAEEFCDWIFDQKSTAWDAATLIALLGRAVPMLNGSKITMIRDEAKTLATAIFTPENMVQGSFRWEVKPNSMQEDYDGLEVTYVDPDTWQEETVLCCMDDEEGDAPEKVTLQGCTSRDHAYHWGMWRRASTRYRRENVVFRTGLEGHIPFYGDLIAVSHDMPRWGSGGFVTAVDEAGTGLTLSEPVVFGDGAYKILLRKKNGDATEPLAVTAGADDLHVVLDEAIDPDDFALEPLVEQPMFLFGVSTLVGKQCTVANLSPADDDTVEVTAIPYRTEPYSFDERVAPAQGDTHGSIPAKPALPGVTGFIVLRSPGVPSEVIATWNAARGATNYVLQLSYDGVGWETLNDYIEGTSFRFTVKPAYIYVRVLAIGIGAGAWAYWTGDAPVEKTSIVVDNDATPDGVSGVLTTAGFGLIWLNWTNSSNANLKTTHVYAADTSTQPGAPTYSIPWPQAFLADNGLADDETRYYWFVEESVGGKFSAVAGPFSETTVDGITLSHLISGGLQPVEIVSVIPSTGNYAGRIVFLTANDAVGADYVTGLGFLANKLYTWKGAGTSTSPVSGKDYWTASAPVVDLSGQIVSGQIADAAILKAKLADNAVSQAKLQDAIVSNAKLVDGAVNSAKLAAAAVATSNIAVGAITASVIAAATITATQIANNAITTPLINAGAITTAKIAAGNITTTELAAGAVTAAKITAGTITATEIASGAITTAKIAAGAITATEIATGTITAAKIGAGEVTAGKIAAGAITATEIAANTITGAKIAAGTIMATEIAANAITSTQLAADSVVAGKIQAGAIVAAAIGTNEVIAQTANIKDGIITKAKIASLEAAKIEAGTLATMVLTAAKTATDSAYFNTGTPSSTFPPTAFQQVEDGTHRTSLGTGGTEVWLMTYYGWATGSGYVNDRFGKADMAFAAFENGGATPNTGYMDLEIIYRINGGSTIQLTPYAVRITILAGSGSLNISGGLKLTGLSSTDTVDFGVRVKADNNASQLNVVNLTVLAFNA